MADTANKGNKEEVATCPLVGWYQFHSCTIKTCKNYTSETAHKCLELDRKKPVSTKTFSDAELNLYKMRDRGVSTRLVQMHRKSAIQNVKAILILQEYIAYIAQRFSPGAVFTKVELLRLEKEYPLKIKRLAWSNWMWEYALDEKVWSEFTEKKGGECKEFSIHQLLAIKLARFEKVLHELNQ